MNIGPQPGPQTEFLRTRADIAIYGGAAGAGKSFGLILETLRHVNRPGFEAVIFRRTTKHITNPGGLWDESQKVFPNLGAQSRETHLEWHIHEGLTLKFAHMEHEKNMYDWQGSQIPLIGFDELTHFSKRQFFYMLSRNRSMTGIPGYVRATTNPDADSWVAKFLAWWIDPDTGYPIPERSGVLRWFIRLGDELIWADSREELIEAHGEEIGGFAKSVTFISASIYDNKILLQKDPQYLANLMALDRVEKARLLGGNWKIRASAGSYFRRSDFEIVPAIYGRVIKRIRYWDRAATEPSELSPNPDWTVGTLMAQTDQNLFFIEHVERFRGSPLKVEQRIKNIAQQDGYQVTIGIEQDPGQAGKAEAGYHVRQLSGFHVLVFPVHKDKVTRAKGYSAQAQAGNVKLVEGQWNDDFLDEHENFPPEENKIVKDDKENTGKDDQVDSASGSFNYLTGDNVGRWLPSSGKQAASTVVPGFFRGTGADEW